MKYRTYYRFGLVWSALLFSSTSVHAVDELWERAEQFVRESAIWMPGKVETSQQVLDGKGEQQSESSMRFAISQDAEQKTLKVTLEQLIENEKDQTEESRQAIEAEFQRELQKIRHDMPFHLENPSQVVTGWSPERKKIGHVECMGYEFQVAVTEDSDQPPMRFSGTVWVDPQTAIPLLIESMLLDLPRKQDGAEIVSLSLQRSYGTVEGSWVAINEEQEIWLNARFLFKKMVIYIKSTTDYRQHWKWKEQL